MSFNWCHNPDCHTLETVSRVRGSGTNKVLRTRKITINSNGYPSGIWAYFCNGNCLFQFLNKFAQQIADTYPVKQPKETPIKIVTNTYEMGWRKGKTYKTIIKG